MVDGPEGGGIIYSTEGWSVRCRYGTPSRQDRSPTAAMEGGRRPAAARIAPREQVIAVRCAARAWTAAG